MHYFIKRSEKLFGPYNLNQIQELAKANKLSGSDLIANNQQGPFQPIQNVLQQFSAGASPSTTPIVVPSAQVQHQPSAAPAAPPSQVIGTAFQYQTNYAKPAKPETTENDRKKILLIVGGSIGGLVSLILILFLFRMIWIEGNEIKEKKQAERAAAIARENSPEVQKKRKEAVQGLVDMVTGQKGQSSSSTGNTSSSAGANQSQRNTVPESQIIKLIANKLSADKDLMQAYDRELKNGELKGNLKSKDVPSALAKMEVYARKGKLNYQDAIQIAKLAKEIDFARGKRGK